MAYRPSRNNAQVNRNNHNYRKRRRGLGITPSKVTDARQKLINRKRETVTDARYVLAEKAKTKDARDRLLILRNIRQGGGELNGNIRPIGTNIYQKTDRNGKISLMTSKNKQSTSDINLAVRQQLGLITQNRKKATTKRSPSSRKTAALNLPPHLIRKTILNDFGFHSFPLVNDEYYPIAGVTLNSASPRLSFPSVAESPLRTRRHLQENFVDWNAYGIQRNRGRITPSGYIDLDAPEDEEMPLVSPVKHSIFMQGPSRLSNVHSRLDVSPAAPTQSHGIFSAPTKTKVVVPAGHRIVVSNLQPTVTQDDIRELFEDIGQLLVARLVRPGTAEVIYKSLKDAQKAVDTYHNRQLDGQPMKCLLVNKRPINNPTGPAVTPKQESAAIIAALSKKAATVKNNEKLVPDLQTIHKVLFQRN